MTHTASGTFRAIDEAATLDDLYSCDKFFAGSWWKSTVTTHFESRRRRRGQPPAALPVGLKPGRPFGP